MDDRTLQGYLVSLLKAPPGSPEHTRGRAELENALVTELVLQMRQSTTVIHSALAGLGSDIASHREELKRAGDAAADGTTALVRWTKWLAVATIALVVASFTLVLVTLLKA